MKIRVGGQPVMSKETRWVHSDHAQAVRDWREHRQRCVQCEKAGCKRDEKRCNDQHETCECSEELDHDLYECLCDCQGRDMTEVTPAP